MLNRLLTSVMILSVLVAVATLAFWWRAAHGHADTVLHLGASSPNQTTIYTSADRLNVAVQQPTPDGQGIVRSVRPLPFRTVLGGAMLVPALWAAVRVRRRLLPRPPGADLPSLRSAR